MLETAFFAAERGATPIPPVASGETAAYALDSLIDAVYEGATESPPWQTALSLLQAQLQADHIVLFLRPPRSPSGALMINPLHEDREARQRYEQCYWDQDPFVGMADGEVLTADEKMGANWRQSAYYRDFLHRLGIHHVIGTDLHLNGDIECWLRATRGLRRAAFSERDRALLQALLPHLRRAIELHARLDRAECARELVSSAVGRLTLGIIWLDSDGTVLRCNEEAERILQQRDGIGLSRKALALDNANEQKILQRLIEAAAGRPAAKSRRIEASPPGMAISRPSGKTRLTLTVKTAPAQRLGGAPQPADLVAFLRDPDAKSSLPAVDQVQRLLGLTRTEARLAVLLAAGHTTDEIARLMSIRRNTARTHLRSIFYKTGVSRQALLVRLLLNSIGTLV